MPLAPLLPQVDVTAVCACAVGSPTAMPNPRPIFVWFAAHVVTVQVAGQVPLPTVHRSGKSGPVAVFCMAGARELVPRIDSEYPPSAAVLIFHVARACCICGAVSSVPRLITSGVPAISDVLLDDPASSDTGSVIVMPPSRWPPTVRSLDIELAPKPVAHMNSDAASRHAASPIAIRRGIRTCSLRLTCTAVYIP